MTKQAVLITSPMASPTDNGRVITALKLVAELKAAGDDVRLHLCGRGVEWIAPFEFRRDGHPFTKHYGAVWDDVKDKISCCNMCCKRFDATADAEKAALPIHGEDSAHSPLGAWVREGFHLVSF